MITSVGVSTRGNGGSFGFAEEIPRVWGLGWDGVSRFGKEPILHCSENVFVSYMPVPVASPGSYNR